MAFPRFFVESKSEDGNPSTKVFYLSSSDSHHAHEVLRLRVGDSVSLILQPSGDEYRGEIFIVSADSVAVRPVEKIEVSGSQLSRLDALVCPLLKGSRNESLCDWATELGARRIIFWHAERSVVKIRVQDRAAKEARWRRIVEGAAKQSRRNTIPDLAIVGELTDALTRLGKDSEGELVYLSLTSGTPSLSSLVGDKLQTAERVSVVLGPEGDLTEAEESQIIKFGAISASLGGTVLRAELAALAGMVLVR